MTLISMMWPPLICCLPDSLLDFLSCLVNRPLMAADVFPLIEHARKSCCEVNTSLICFYFCHIQSHFLSITRFAVFISTKREVRIQHSSWSFIVNTWQPTHARAIKYFTLCFPNQLGDTSHFFFFSRSMRVRISAWRRPTWFLWLLFLSEKVKIK